LERIPAFALDVNGSGDINSMRVGGLVFAFVVASVAALVHRTAAQAAEGEQFGALGAVMPALTGGFRTYLCHAIDGDVGY
jgi:hypothetical protein